MTTSQTKHYLLNQYQNEVWYWNKKPIRLKECDYFQLASIKKLLRGYYPSIRYIGNKVNIVNRMYYGKSSEYWLKAVNHIEKHNNFNDFKEVINTIKEKKIKKAEKD